MMKQLQSNSVAVLQSLRDRITNLNLKDYNGEDVMKAVSRIRGVLKRLRSLERRDASGNVLIAKVPSDLAKTLLEVFQTTSDSNFNKLFEAKFLFGFQESITKGDKAYGTPKEILIQAESYYSALYSSKLGWTGEVQKSHKSAFTTTGAPGQAARICFTCGGTGQSLDTCTKWGSN
jgi:hypothetical protein